MTELGMSLTTDDERGRPETVFLETRLGEPKGARGILSRIMIAFSRYWYIRGVTPRCRIRRW